ncbi:hypothetical protein OIU76_006923 [Salix suchowensis]|nr:hypothetical protein OIU76_006923 [Salix suchowensis]
MNTSQKNGARRYKKSEHPRLRWTPELHEHFAEAVDRLGGKYKATPKRILQTMSVKELKISHIKSHLQEPLQAERLLHYDMGMSSSFSSQSNGILQAKEGGGDPEQQDSGTSFAVSKSREENIDRLPAETCELSLSFTPSMACCTIEERELWPLINDQHHREYNSTINGQDLQFESSHINLDLTI